MNPTAQDRSSFSPAPPLTKFSAASSSMQRHASPSLPSPADPNVDHRATFTTSRASSSNSNEQVLDADDVFQKLLSLRVTSDTDRVESSQLPLAPTSSTLPLPSVVSSSPQFHTIPPCTTLTASTLLTPAISYAPPVPVPLSSSLPVIPSATLPPDLVSNPMFHHRDHSSPLLQQTVQTPAQFQTPLHPSYYNFQDLETAISYHDPHLNLSDRYRYVPPDSSQHPTGPVGLQSQLPPMNYSLIYSTDPAASNAMYTTEAQIGTSPLHFTSGTVAPRIKNDLYKTEICRSYADNGGFCKYGLKCQFAHGEAELRPVRRHPRYKTKWCRNFLATGSCPYDSRCRFIHSPLEHLAATIDVMSSGNVSEGVSSMSSIPPLSQHFSTTTDTSNPSFAIQESVPPVGSMTASVLPPSGSGVGVFAPTSVDMIVLPSTSHVATSSTHVFAPAICEQGTPVNSSTLLGNGVHDSRIQRDHRLEFASNVFSTSTNYGPGNGSTGVGFVGSAQAKIWTEKKYDGAITGNNHAAQNAGIYSMERLVVQNGPSGGSVGTENTSDSEHDMLRNVGFGSLVRDDGQAGTRVNGSHSNSSGVIRSRLPVFRNMVAADEE